MPTLQYLADEFYEDNEIEYVITKDEEVGSTSKTKITVGNHDVIYTKLIKYPYEFGIDKNYKLASINGTKLAAVTEEQYQQLKSDYDSLLSRIVALENNQGTNGNSSDGNPVGTIIAYSADSVPQGGYLKCEGQSISRTEYAALFNIIGTTYGADDSTTFKVPDLRGEFLRGAGTNSHENQGSGENVGEHQNATKVILAGTDWSGNSTFPHYGSVFNKNSINADYQYDATTNGYFSAFQGTWNDSRNSWYAVRPTNTSVLYCIKY